MILNLKQSTPNCMLHGELGVLPLSVTIKNRVLNYWSKLINSKEDKICNIFYRTCCKLYEYKVQLVILCS